MTANAERAPHGASHLCADADRASSSFKGQFDGEMKWLSSWIGTDGAMAEELLAGLAEKGLVETCRNSYGHPYSASNFSERD